jgi:RNA polymerase sigma-70 factor (ECF subfamily)
MTAIQALFEEAKRLHPTVTVSESTFAAAFQKRDGVADERAGDILLVAGLEANDAAALDWLLSQVKQTLRQLRQRVSQQLLDDIESRALELMVVGTPGHGPRITAYAGKGPLSAWVRVLVTRTGRDLAEKAGAKFVELESAMLGELEDAQQTSPELTVLRRASREHLMQSITAATQRLTPRERTLMSLHYLDGVGLEELGRTYQVHRITITRWLAAARTSLLEGCRDELATRAKLDALEVDSFIRALQTQLDISLRRLLVD